MKHTKGPWIIFDQRVNEFDVMTHEISAPEAEPNEITGLAEVYGSDEEGYANAKLIASSPELLQALIDARVTIKAFLPEAFATLQVIESAISKATE